MLQNYLKNINCIPWPPNIPVALKIINQTKYAKINLSKGQTVFLMRPSYMYLKSGEVLRLD